MTVENTRKALEAIGIADWLMQSYLDGIEANPARLLDAMVAEGMVRAVVWCPVHNRDEAPERNLCRSAGITVTRYEVVPPEPPPRPRVERLQPAHWGTDGEGQVRMH